MKRIKKQVRIDLGAALGGVNQRQDRPRYLPLVAVIHPERRKTDVSKKNVFDTKDATASVSESENPAIPSPTPKRGRPRTNKDWWPNQLDLSILQANSPLSDPMDKGFNYAEEFKTLDVEALKRH